MELSPGQQRGLFVVLVVLLAGVGIYLVGPGRSHGSAPSSSPGTPAPSSNSGGASATPALAGVPPAVIAPASLPVPTVVKGANIYNWLPFTQQDLDAAANVTVAFLAAYQTYSYTDTVNGYGHRLSSYATPTLLTNMEQTFQLGLPTWKQKQQAFKSGGTISRITAFGSSPQASITFLVTLTQQTTTNGQISSTIGSYDVTAEAVAGGWQVNDIEQAGAGNQ